MFFSRLPERGGCDCRDQCPGHQPVPDIPLGGLWAEAPHSPGSPANRFEGMQAPHQGGLIWSVHTPQNTSLVSAVYWLDSEPRGKFSQPLTLEIQHCVKPTHTSRLSFVHAKCSQTQLPYVFEPVEGGEFSSESSYGCVQLDHFSLLGVSCNDPITGVRLYRACLFYLSGGANLRHIHFVITWDEEPHTTVSQCAVGYCY